MAKRATKKIATSRSLVSMAKPASDLAMEPAPEPKLAKPRVFVHDVCDEHPDLAYARYWWDQKHEREGITPWIEKKLRPGEDPTFGHAAKAEVLLPPTAPSDYMDVRFLTAQFDRALPPFEKHAMVQTKVILDPEEAWHIGYERVRSFARAHFAMTHLAGCCALSGRTWRRASRLGTGHADSCAGDADVGRGQRRCGQPRSDQLASIRLGGEQSSGRATQAGLVCKRRELRDWGGASRLLRGGVTPR